MRLDYAEERRMVEAVAQLGWRYDKATNGFHRPNGGWVSWAQTEQAWLAALVGQPASDIAPESETIARTVNKAANDERF